MILRFTVRGVPRTKKNSQRIVRGKNRTLILPSASYVLYEKEFIRQVPSAAKLGINQPVNVRCIYYMPTRRKVDLLNLEAATHDILVKAGVLEDDNRDVIIGTDGSRVFHDTANPRVEIEIIDVEGFEQWSKR